MNKNIVLFIKRMCYGFGVWPVLLGTWGMAAAMGILPSHLGRVRRRRWLVTVPRPRDVATTNSTDAQVSDGAGLQRGWFP